MDDTNDTLPAPASMARVTSLVRACADTINDLTPEQCDLIDRLGVDAVDLWLGMIQIALESDDQPNTDDRNRSNNERSN